AIRDGGGERADVDAKADALVWLDSADLDGLRRARATASAARWIQLPMAGVERMADAGLLDPGRTWTSAKGAYAEPVAEHALALALAGLRSLRRRISARSWGEPAGQSLYDEPVTARDPPARCRGPGCTRRSPAPGSYSWPSRSRRAPRRSSVPPN